MAAPLGFPPYSAGFPPSPYQLNDPAYRKNATRDATSTLKAWLQEHRKNPYPTKGEKIMLAIITKMTLTQVSTWFANARRRLKKENKMTWGARSKSDDEEEEEGTRTERKDDEEEKHNDNGDASAEDEGISLHVDSLTDHSVESDGEKVPCRIDGFACKPGTDLKDKRSEIDLTSPHGSHGSLSPKPMISSPLSVVEAPVSDPIRDKTKVCTDTQSQNTKPKLWSLAEIATSDNKQNQNCSPTGTIWNSSQSGASPSAAILARPIYYTSPFYGNYGSYGNFGQGILRYGSIHKHSPESMLKANHANQVQMEQHFIRASHAESKKDSGEVCTLGPQSFLSS